jgi:abortive infection bacteriophage resistance protein
MRYTKPPLTFDDQLQLLLGRGLLIADTADALHWLRHVSYYRLSAYMLPFKGADGRFQPGTTFEQVTDLYVFDRKLRLLLLDAIERVEVALRTSLTYALAHEQGPFGYADPHRFPNGFRHDQLMEELGKAKDAARETFVDHFMRKYHSEPHLPIWMASELLSFGRLSRLYQASHPNIRRKFAARLNVPESYAVSWMHCLSYVRNVCAHHSRMWNRHLAVKPAMPSRSRSWAHDVASNERLYCVLVILQHTLMQVAPSCGWRARLTELLAAHPAVPLLSMQIPDDWRESSLWAGV